ncbi:MAG: hypothetical protein MUE51_08495 [Thermoleophilia bacterium]|jgi:hypothetical protein|nr:hypothetical protein [Thermoleophilia bacterium]
MKRVLIVAVVAIAGAAAVRRCARGRRRCDVEQRIDRMPERSPRRWLFTNVRAIRENTERILAALERQGGAPADRVE